MPRRMNFNKTLNRFCWERVEVQDTVGDYVEGVWVERQTLDLPREIKAIVLLMDSQDLRIYSNGSDSSSMITLTTKSDLYFTDINLVEQEQRQSYVIFKNYKYRVLGTNLMQGNVLNLNIYRAERYLQ